MEEEIRCAHFEVFGKVQRVWMRAYTVHAARCFGLRGYVLNTESGTVKGEAYGSARALEGFKEWLGGRLSCAARRKGAPPKKAAMKDTLFYPSAARIDRCEFALLAKSSALFGSMEECPYGEFAQRKVVFSNGSQWA